jgi:hypothetical protein
MVLAAKRNCSRSLLAIQLWESIQSKEQLVFSSEKRAHSILPV